MTKPSLAAQLRHYAVQQGDFSVTEMDDDEVIKKYADVSHVSGETLNRLVESSLNEEHFRAICAKIGRDEP